MLFLCALYWYNIRSHSCNGLLLLLTISKFSFNGAPLISRGSSPPPFFTIRAILKLLAPAVIIGAHASRASSSHYHTGNNNSHCNKDKGSPLRPVQLLRLFEKLIVFGIFRFFINVFQSKQFALQVDRNLRIRCIFVVLVDILDLPPHNLERLSTILEKIDESNRYIRDLMAGAGVCQPVDVGDAGDIPAVWIRNSDIC